MKENFFESFSIGTLSFLLPFIGAMLFTYLFSQWSLQASMIAGCALSTTSLAVVYSVLVETGLSNTNIGKRIMSATFITDMWTALTLSIIFIKPTLYTLLFVFISVFLIIIFYKFSIYILRNPRWANKINEPEIKFIFFILFAFIYFAKLGEGHAVLPAFILGLIMSKHFYEQRKTVVVRNKLRTVAYAIVTPLFFIVGGMHISYKLIIASIGLFLVLFAVKMIMKFIGVYILAKKYIQNGSMYTTLLMCTGLTFGTISSLYGLQTGIINEVQYSVLVGIVVASAVIPTFIAQKWFMPQHTEDLYENGNKD